MRSTATLATYFETLYPNAVLCVRLGQDLHCLDRLVGQRLLAVTELERSMYANFLGNKRPTVRVGEMSDGVDATRHYEQILADLNAAIEKEQSAAKTRAQFVDRSQGVDALSIIEKFLQVTEIGSLKKLLKKQSGSSNKWLRTPGAYSTTLKYDDSNEKLKLESIEEDEIRNKNVSKSVDRDGYEEYDSYQSERGMISIMNFKNYPYSKTHYFLPFFLLYPTSEFFFVHFSHQSPYIYYFITSTHCLLNL